MKFLRKCIEIVHFLFFFLANCITIVEGLAKIKGKEVWDDIESDFTNDS